MAKAITRQELDGVIARLNRVTGSPDRLYTVNALNVGHYCLDKANGGYKLVRVRPSGGMGDVLGTGYIPKRELYLLIHAYMSGFLDAQITPED